MVAEEGSDSEIGYVIWSINFLREPTRRLCTAARLRLYASGMRELFQRRASMIPARSSPLANKSDVADISQRIGGKVNKRRLSRFER